MSINWDAPEDDQPPPSPGTGANAVVPDFGSFMARVFPEARPGSAAEGGPMPPRLRRDYETALTLLQRAAEAVPALLHHCQQLEAEMRGLRTDLQAELQAAQGKVHQWQQIAVAMKMHIEESDHEIAVLRKRLASAEEQMVMGQQMAAAAEQQASLAIGVTTMFHDKIIDAFGVGSPAHAALDAIATGRLRTGDKPPREDG